MTNKMNDEVISRLLEEFIEDSGSDRDDDYVEDNDIENRTDDEPNEPVYSDLLPVSFENENLVENLVDMMGNFDDVLTVSLTDIRDVNDVPPENIMNNFDISKEWGFEDTEDELMFHTRIKLIYPFIY